MCLQVVCMTAVLVRLLISSVGATWLLPLSLIDCVTAVFDGAYSAAPCTHPYLVLQSVLSCACMQTALGRFSVESLFCMYVKCMIPGCVPAVR
jgi:hypothetical protein